MVSGGKGTDNLAKDSKSYGKGNVWSKTNEEKKKTDQLMGFSSLEETMTSLAKANGVRWHGNVLRRVVLVTHVFVKVPTSTRRRSDLFGLRVKLPPVTTSLTTQR